MSQDLLVIATKEVVDLTKEAGELVKLDSLPAPAKALLQPLSAYAVGDKTAIVTWPLTQKAALPANASYALDVSFSETLTFNAADTWAAGDSAGKLLSISVAGGVTLTGSAALPFTYGKVVVGGQAGAQVGLTYFFRSADTDIYAEAVAARLQHLPNPFDLASMWTKVQEPAFEGVRFDFTGSAKFSVAVSIADAFSLGSAGVNVGINVSVGAGVTDQYALELRRAPQDAGARLHAKLSRSRESDTDFSGSLGVEIDMSALTQAVGAALKTAVSQWDAALKPIEDFLAPGTWLKNQADAALKKSIAGLVSDTTLQAALISDAEAAIGVKALESSALSDWLNKQLASAVDQSSVLIKGQATGAAAPVLGALAKLAPSLSSAAADQLNTTVAAALKSIDDGFEKAVEGLGFGQALTDALKKAGAAVNGVVQNADQAFAPIRQILTQADKQFHDVLSKAQEAIAQKVTVKLYLEDSRSDSTDIEVAGTFLNAEQSAQDLFRALTLGNLRTLTDMVEGGQAATGFTLEDSTVTRLIQSKSEEGVDVTFLDFTLKGSTLLTTKVQTIVDSNGNVRVLSNGDVTKELQTPFSTRGADFADAYTIVQAAAAHGNGSPPVLQMGVEAYFLAATLEWAKVETFVKSLRLNDINLISDGAWTKAKAVFDDWSGGSGRINGRLSAALRLSGAQIDNLVKLRPLTAGDLVAIVEAGHDADQQLGNLIKKNFEDGKVFVARLYTSEADAQTRPYQQVVREFDDKLRNTLSDPDNQGRPAPGDSAVGDPEADDQFQQFVMEARDLNLLADLISAMNAVYRAAASAKPGDGGWDAAQYDHNQQQIVGDAVHWMTLWNPVFEEFFFSGRITRRTIAFMRALADLAGLKGQPAVTLTLTCTLPNGDKKTAAFQ